ncbi:unnamed protein product [Cylindrotheca closterium]|uniref:YdhG-like domain-containing protein n=1 Tax=Cylindrotheca closterium TaxID=2856 RepID=A0AAD2FPP5_9STRA|nr:unnamed protein product [Cylindrotheca closterium]
MVTLRPRKIKATIGTTKEVIATKNKSSGRPAAKIAKMAATCSSASSSGGKTKTTKATSSLKKASKTNDARYKVTETSTASSLKGAKDPEGILEEYLTTMVADHDETKHAAIKELHALIRQKAPNLVPELQGKSTLAYGGFDYVTKSKCTGRWSRLSIMVNKKGLSLVVCGYKDGKYLLEHYPKKYFGKVLSVGKSCIRFTKLEDLNMEHIGEVLEESNSADISAMFA